MKPEELKDKVAQIIERFYDWPDRPYDDFMVLLMDEFNAAIQAAYEDAAQIANEAARRSDSLIDDTETDTAKIVLFSNTKFGHNLAERIRQRAKEVTQ